MLWPSPTLSPTDPVPRSLLTLGATGKLPAAGRAAARVLWPRVLVRHADATRSQDRPRDVPVSGVLRLSPLSAVAALCVCLAPLMSPSMLLLCVCVPGCLCVCVGAASGGTRGAQLRLNVLWFSRPPLALLSPSSRPPSHARAHAHRCESCLTARHAPTTVSTNICNPAHRVSRPRGTGSVGDGVGEGARSSTGARARCRTYPVCCSMQDIPWPLTRQPQAGSVQGQ